MSALNLENSRTKVYGWLAGSFNFSTSAQNNFPVSYDIFPNKIELNQAVVYIERLADTVQNTHFDYGYHVTGFYGIDYRFTTAKGYFSEQLLLSNKQYGFDPALEYFDPLFSSQGWSQHPNRAVPFSSWNRSAIGAEQLQHDALAALHH